MSAPKAKPLGPPIAQNTEAHPARPQESAPPKGPENPVGGIPDTKPSEALSTEQGKPQAPQQEPQPNGLAYPLEVIGLNLAFLRALKVLPPGKDLGDGADLINRLNTTGVPVTLKPRP